MNSFHISLIQAIHLQFQPSGQQSYLFYQCKQSVTFIGTAALHGEDVLYKKDGPEQPSEPSEYASANAYPDYNYHTPKPTNSQAHAAISVAPLCCIIFFRDFFSCILFI